MIQYIIEKVKALGTFIRDTMLTAGKVIISFVKETVINSPAVVMMSFASFGIANTMTRVGVQSFFTPVPYINEVMIVSVLSVSVVLILATIAGNIAEARE